MPVSSVFFNRCGSAHTPDRRVTDHTSAQHGADARDILNFATRRLRSIATSARWKRHAMSDLEKFRSETRAWLEANCPPEMRRPMTSDERHLLGRPQRQILVRAAARLVRADARQGLDRAGLAEGIWRRRARCRAEHKVLREEMAAIGARSPLSSLRHLDARAGAAEIRHRGAEAGASAEDRARRDPLVPGLFRAERRLRPRLAADPRRERRRRFHHQRPEDLDLLRQLRRLDLLPGAHRFQRPRSTTASVSSCSTWPRRASRPSRSC